MAAVAGTLLTARLQAAYAEFYGSPVLWPDFGPDAFDEALKAGRPGAEQRLDSYFDRLPEKQRYLFAGVSFGRFGDIDTHQVLTNVLEAGQLRGVLGRLALGVVEVGGDGDDGAEDVVVKAALRTLAQGGEDLRRNLDGRLDAGLAVDILEVGNRHHRLRDRHGRGLRGLEAAALEPVAQRVGAHAQGVAVDVDEYGNRAGMGDGGGGGGGGRQGRA